MFPSILYLSGFCLVFDIALPRPYTFSVTGVIKRTWTELTVCVGWNQRHMKPPVLLIIFTFVMKMPWSTVENQTNMLLASCPIKDKGGWLFNCFFFFCLFVLFLFLSIAHCDHCYISLWILIFGESWEFQKNWKSQCGKLRQNHHLGAVISSLAQFQGSRFRSH